MLSLVLIMLLSAAHVRVHASTASLFPSTQYSFLLNSQDEAELKDMQEYLALVSMMGKSMIVLEEDCLPRLPPLLRGILLLHRSDCSLLGRNMVHLAGDACSVLGRAGPVSR